MHKIVDVIILDFAKSVIPFKYHYIASNLTYHVLDGHRLYMGINTSRYAPTRWDSLE